jgi:uncharacterized membrane protein YeaQ/YmgE (transglycosylase-associated protein family)
LAGCPAPARPTAERDEARCASTVDSRSKQTKRRQVSFDRFSGYVNFRAGSPAAAPLGKDIETMGILSWILVGLIAGFLAKYVVPGEGPGGIIGDIVIGIVGAFVGGFIFNAFGHIGVNGLDVYSILVAFVGAVVLLFNLRANSGRRVA